MSVQKTTVGALKKSAIYQMLKSGPATKIGAPSTAEIAEITPLLKSLSSMKVTYLIVVNLAILGLLLAAITLIVISSPTTHFTNYILSAFTGSVVMYAVKWFVFSYFSPVDELNQGLSPLKELESCERALKLAEALPVCNDYRTAVLNQGREFLNLDLALMEKQAKNLAFTEAAERAEQVCKKLHGIPA